MIHPRFQFCMATCLAALCVSCGSTRDSATQKNVFGIDNREDITSTAYPWGAIGRLDSGCTGTLVAKNLVLTAAHCVVDSASKGISTAMTYFRPAFRRNSDPMPTWITHVWYGTDEPEKNRAQDWAILRLESPIGDTYKWMRVTVTDIAGHLPYSTNVAGYSADRNNGDTPSVHRDCYIHEVLEGRLLNDCDATNGVSGGPMFTMIGGTPDIIAIAVSEYRGTSNASLRVDSYSQEHANVGIPASAFYPTLDTIRKYQEIGQMPPSIDNVKEASNPNVPNTGTTGPNLPDPASSEPTTTPVATTTPVPTTTTTIPAVDLAVLLPNIPAFHSVAYEVLSHVSQMASTAAQYSWDPNLRTLTTNLVGSASAIESLAAQYLRGERPEAGAETMYAYFYGFERHWSALTVYWLQYPNSMPYYGAWMNGTINDTTSHVYSMASMLGIRRTSQ